MLKIIGKVLFPVLQPKAKSEFDAPTQLLQVQLLPLKYDFVPFIPYRPENFVEHCNPCLFMEL